VLRQKTLRRSTRAGQQPQPGVSHSEESVAGKLKEKKDTCEVCEDIGCVPSMRRGPVKNLCCMKCGEKLCGRAHLKIHLRLSHNSRLRSPGKRPTHTQQKVCMCDVCGAVLSNSGNLSALMALHRGLKEHVCGVCKKNFHLRERIEV
jgi:hypothetical protein